MQTRVILLNPLGQILRSLSKATSTVHLALSSPMEPDLLKQLCSIAASGIDVKLIFSDDKEHENHHKNLNKAGGKVLEVYSAGFPFPYLSCLAIIDETSLLMRPEEKNRSRGSDTPLIILSENPELIKQCMTVMQQTESPSSVTLSTEGIQSAIYGRLQVLRHLIHLDDQDDIRQQLQKLQHLLKKGQSSGDVLEIITHLNNGHSSLALSKIEKFTQNNCLVQHQGHHGEQRYKLSLQLMELLLNILEAERVEHENKLHSFHARHTREVGEIIKKILELQCNILEESMHHTKEKEEEYHRARRDFQDYCEDYEKTSHHKIHEISKSEELEMKSLFRACSKLCHPDMVGSENKEEAAHFFAELCDANEKKNLPQMKKLHNQLEKGILTPMGATLSDMSKLHNYFLLLQDKTTTLTGTIYALVKSKSYQKIPAIENWDQYFSELKRNLLKKLEILEGNTG